MNNDLNHSIIGSAFTYDQFVDFSVQSNYKLFVENLYYKENKAWEAEIFLNHA